MDVPEILVKAAGELQSAFRQGADLKQEVKEINEKLKKTPEWEAVKDARKLVKAFEKANPRLQELRDDLKAARKKLQDLPLHGNLAEARKRYKDYKAAIIDTAKSMAEEITGSRLADAT